MILILLIALIIPSVSIYFLITKKYFDNEYVIVKIYDENCINLYLYYINQNKQYYNLNVSTNYGDPEIKYQKFAVDKLNHDYCGLYTCDIYTDIKQKVNFDDKYLDIEGYFMFDIVSYEDYNKNTITIRYMQVHILKKNDIKYDLKLIFDKINTYQNNNEVRLNYFVGDKCKYSTDDFDFRKNNFYIGNKGNIYDEKIITPFFHKDSDMLWSFVKNIYLNKGLDNLNFSKNKVLLHGPSGCGKSTFIIRMATYLHRSITTLNFPFLKKDEIYKIFFGYMETDICLFENLDITLNKLNIRNIKYKKSIYHFKIDDLLSLVRNPFIIKSTIATTTNYDEIKKTYPKFLEPGRFIPIHFGYVDTNTLQDICMYFFGKKIKGYVPEAITIPTSDIIDLAFESLIFGKISFDYFNDKLLKLI